MIEQISYRDLKTEDDNRKFKDVMRDFGAITQSSEKFLEIHRIAMQRLARKLNRQTMIAKSYAPSKQPADT